MSDFPYGSLKAQLKVKIAAMRGRPNPMAASRRVPFPPIFAKRWAPTSLLLGVAALYIYRLGNVYLYDDDESVYAEISREMLALKNWSTPRLNFIPYLEKPPLFYWLNTAAFKVLGLSEFAARLPTALAAVAGVACVYAIGRQLWGRQSGLAAGAILATSFGYFVFGRMMMPDMLFVVLLTATFWGFSRALLDPSAPRVAVFGGYTAMGGAVLAKGVIGLIFPSLAIGAFLLLTRDRRIVRRLEIARGSTLLFLIVVPWHLLMEHQYPGFLRYYIVDKHVYRFLGHPELLSTKSLPIPTYLVMTLVWFCPWSFFLPAALCRYFPGVLAGHRLERGFLFVLLWAGAVVGFFALSASRLEYYALPALPPLALCVGRFWGSEISLPRPRSLGTTWAALLAFAACLVPLSCLFPRLEQMRFYNLFPNVIVPAESLRGGILATAKIYEVPGFACMVPLLQTAAALILIGTGASAWAWYRLRPTLALACLVVSMGSGLATVEQAFLLYSPYRSVAQLAGVLRQELRPGEQIVVDGKYEHHAGMAFYTGQQVGVYRGLNGILMYGTRYTGTKRAFIPEKEFAQLWKGSSRAYFLSDMSDSLSWLGALSSETIVLGRTGNSWLFANRARIPDPTGNAWAKPLFGYSRILMGPRVKPL